MGVYVSFRASRVVGRDVYPHRGALLGYSEELWVHVEYEAEVGAIPRDYVELTGGWTRAATYEDGATLCRKKKCVTGDFRIVKIEDGRALARCVFDTTEMILDHLVVKVPEYVNARWALVCYPAETWEEVVTQDVEEARREKERGGDVYIIPEEISYVGEKVLPVEARAWYPGKLVREVLGRLLR